VEHSVETPNATSIATMSDAPYFSARHIMVPAKPTIAPMEISKLPDIMRTVTPADIRPKVDTCDNTPLILSMDTNLGFSIAVTTPIKTMMMTR